MMVNRYYGQCWLNRTVAHKAYLQCIITSDVLERDSRNPAKEIIWAKTAKAVFHSKTDLLLLRRPAQQCSVPGIDKGLMMAIEQSVHAHSIAEFSIWQSLIQLCRLTTSISKLYHSYIKLRYKDGFYAVVSLSMCIVWPSDQTDQLGNIFLVKI